MQLASPVRLTGRSARNIYLVSVSLRKGDFTSLALSDPCSDKTHNYRSKIFIVDLQCESPTNFKKHDSGERGEWYSKYRL